MTGLPKHPMIVDVCGTLVHDDTTIGLLRYHFLHGRGKAWRWRSRRLRLLSAAPVRFCFAVLEKLIGKHVYKAQMIALLSGESAVALEESAGEYAQQLLETGRCKAVTAAIENAWSEKRLVLASASLSPIVAALAVRLDAPYVASKLEVRDEVLTGKMVVDLTGAKAVALAELNQAPLEPGTYDMISDNFSDLEILQNAHEATVVLRAQTHRSRWKGRLSARYIEVFFNS